MLALVVYSPLLLLIWLYAIKCTTRHFKAIQLMQYYCMINPVVSRDSIAVNICTLTDRLCPGHIQFIWCSLWIFILLTHHPAIRFMDYGHDYIQYKLKTTQEHKTDKKAFESLTIFLSVVGACRIIRRSDFLLHMFIFRFLPSVGNEAMVQCDLYTQLL